MNFNKIGIAAFKIPQRYFSHETFQSLGLQPFGLSRTRLRILNQFKANPGDAIPKINKKNGRAQLEAVVCRVSFGFVYLFPDVSPALSNS